LIQIKILGKIPLALRRGERELFTLGLLDFTFLVKLYFFHTLPDNFLLARFLKILWIRMKSRLFTKVRKAAPLLSKVTFIVDYYD